MKRFNFFPNLRTCHDIRKMVICKHCKGFGNKSHMVKDGKADYAHGRCYIASEGVKSFLSLPQNMTDSLCLEDIGHKAAKALLEQRQ